MRKFLSGVRGHFDYYSITPQYSTILGGKARNRFYHICNLIDTYRLWATDITNIILDICIKMMKDTVSMLTLVQDTRSHEGTLFPYGPYKTADQHPPPLPPSTSVSEHGAFKGMRPWSEFLKVWSEEKSYKGITLSTNTSSREFLTLWSKL